MADQNFADQIEYAVAERSVPGEIISGDRSLVQFHSEGVLLAVVDGAGHGLEAAEAAAIAVSTLITSPSALPNSLLNLCHEALRSTRGAVISLASIRSSDKVMSWAGVGNVEIVLLRKENSSFKRETLLLRNGVIGYRYVPPRESQLQLRTDDMIIFATDGIDPFFLDGISLEDSCQSIAKSILDRHAKETDDALVLVVRLIEGTA